MKLQPLSFLVGFLCLFLSAGIGAQSNYGTFLTPSGGSTKVGIGISTSSMVAHEKLAVRGGSISVGGVSSGYLLGANSGGGHDWATKWYGLELGNANTFSLAIDQMNTFHHPVVLSGFYGVGLRTAYGGLSVGQNGIVVIDRTDLTTGTSVFSNLAAESDTYHNWRRYVDGGIRARKVKVDTDTWPDYVFAEDYHLPSLVEVANFIAAHHHLPDVPSEQEILENGIDLGEMDGILLKKIEELTLYIIEQDKRIKELQAEVDKLKNK